MELPYITADLAGVGGVLKAKPTDFCVEEISLYEPARQGEHVYVRLTREGWSTPELHQQLVELFDLRRVDVGYAGLKDKHARATQTFSLYLPNADPATVAHEVENSLPVHVHWSRRHTNKLKKGHLLGNRFRILVRGPGGEAVSVVETIALALHQRGLPNFFGEQRFGITGKNAELGREVLAGRGPRDLWTRRFLLSALQAELFNVWLVARMGRGWFDCLLTGDIAKKVDTGGLFDVQYGAAEAARFQQREITYTGPIYGSRTRWARGAPGELEQTVLAKAGLTRKMLRTARLNASRRPGRLFVEDLHFESSPQGLVFTFALPKAAYATILLREFMKVETELSVEE